MGRTMDPHCFSFHLFKGAASRDVNEVLSKQRFCSIFDRPFTEIFDYFSQNDGVILKMDPLIL